MPQHRLALVQLRQGSRPHAHLLRGWIGVFSAGMDELAAELTAQGLEANAIGDRSWKSTVSKIVQDKAAGKLGALVLVGHSQGAINAIDARSRPTKSQSISW